MTTNTINENALLNSKSRRKIIIPQINNLEKNEEKYFEIFLRKLNLINGKIVYNVIFYDVTDLINSKNKIIAENFHKTRIFAKIAHEFKTPLNSIQSIIETLSNRDDNEIKNFFAVPEEKTLNFAKIKFDENIFDNLSNTTNSCEFVSLFLIIFKTTL